MIKKFVLMMVVLCALGMFSNTLGDDVYYYVALNRLKVGNGQLSASTSVDQSLRNIDRSMRSNIRNYMQPYAVGSNGEEIYLRYKPEGRSRNWNINLPISNMVDATFMAIRTAKPNKPSGILYLPKADFSGIDGKKSLFISAVEHKAYVAVDESGTEAAAATAVVMKRGGRPPRGKLFRADRPFLYMIRDTKTGCILFVGRVVDPR